MLRAGHEPRCGGGSWHRHRAPLLCGRSDPARQRVSLRRLTLFVCRGSGPVRGRGGGGREPEAGVGLRAGPRRPRQRPDGPAIARCREPERGRQLEAGRGRRTLEHDAAVAAEGDEIASRPGPCRPEEGSRRDEADDGRRGARDGGGGRRPGPVADARRGCGAVHRHARRTGRRQERSRDVVAREMARGEIAGRSEAGEHREQNRPAPAAAPSRARDGGRRRRRLRRRRLRRRALRRRALRRRVLGRPGTAWLPEAPRGRGTAEEDACGQAEEHGCEEPPAAAAARSNRPHRSTVLPAVDDSARPGRPVSCGSRRPAPYSDGAGDCGRARASEDGAGACPPLTATVAGRLRYPRPTADLGGGTHGPQRGVAPTFAPEARTGRYCAGCSSSSSDSRSEARRPRALPMRSTNEERGRRRSSPGHRSSRSGSSCCLSCSPSVTLAPGTTATAEPAVSAGLSGRADEEEADDGTRTHDLRRGKRVVGWVSSPQKSTKTPE